MLFPENPNLVLAGVEAFLARTEESYACRLFFKGCENCPLPSICTEAKIG